MSSQNNSKFFFEFSSNLNNTHLIKNLTQVVENKSLFNNVIKIANVSNEEFKITIILYPESIEHLQYGTEKFYCNIENMFSMMTEEYNECRPIFVLFIANKLKNNEIIKIFNLIDYIIYNKKFKIFFVK